MKINKKNALSIYDEVFMKTFAIKKQKLKNLKYQDIKNWDSVGHMSLVTSLEKKFKIELEINHIVDFSSYEKGKKILAKYKIKF